MENFGEMPSRKKAEVPVEVEKEPVFNPEEVAEFNEWIKNKIEKSGISWKEYAEKYEKEVYDNYLQSLDLDEQELRNKKILDLGAGGRDFAGYCSKHGISDQVFSVEPMNERYANFIAKKEIWTEDQKREIDGKTVKALQQALPFKEDSFDLLLINSAMPGRDNKYYGELSMEEDIDSSYDEIVRVLSKGGEARIAPFNEDEKNKLKEPWEIARRNWELATKRKIVELSKRVDLEVLVERMETEDDEKDFRITIKKKSEGVHEDSASEKEKEFTIENKNKVGKAWSEMVLGTDVPSIDFEEVSDEDMKKWFSISLEKEIDSLVNEWGIAPDESLIEKIKLIVDEEERSKAQAEYIMECQKKIYGMVEDFRKKENHSTRWDTLPIMMRENKSFNCVGASLVGRSLLEKAGIENYYGNPTGHAVNLAKLDNGDWWYVDFLNGSKNVKKISPVIKKINDLQVLQIDEDKSVDYNLVPVVRGEDVPVFLFGNLHSIPHEALDETLADELPEKRIAKEFTERFRYNFEKIDFGEIERGLYPGITEFRHSEEMEAEKKRIDSLYTIFDEVFPAIKKKYSEEEWKVITSEAKEKLPALKDFFYQENEAALDSMSGALAEVLKEYDSKLAKLKQENSEVYRSIIDAIVANIESFNSGQ